VAALLLKTDNKFADERPVTIASFLALRTFLTTADFLKP
jgi:hypothetical protein